MMRSTIDCGIKVRELCFTSYQEVHIFHRNLNLVSIPTVCICHLIVDCGQRHRSSESQIVVVFLGRIGRFVVISVSSISSKVSLYVRQFPMLWMKLLSRLIERCLQYVCSFFAVLEVYKVFYVEELLEYSTRLFFLNFFRWFCLRILYHNVTVECFRVLVTFFLLVCQTLSCC